MEKSESIKELAAALCAFQGELETATKGKEGYGYKYADLAEVLDTVRCGLKEHGLSVVQMPIDSEAGCGVESILLHSSGQWVSGVLSMPVDIPKGMSRAQAVGSVITYARRYALSAILGVAAEDNDAAVGEGSKPLSKKSAPKQNNGLTDTQRHNIWTLAQDCWGEAPGMQLAAACDELKIPRKSADLTAAQASTLLDRLRALKNGEAE